MRPNQNGLIRRVRTHLGALTSTAANGSETSNGTSRSSIEEPSTASVHRPSPRRSLSWSLSPRSVLKHLARRMPGPPSINTALPRSEPLRESAFENPSTETLSSASSELSAVAAGGLDPSTRQLALDRDALVRPFRFPAQAPEDPERLIDETPLLDGNQGTRPPSSRRSSVSSAVAAGGLSPDTRGRAAEHGGVLPRPPASRKNWPALQPPTRPLDTLHPVWITHLRTANGDGDSPHPLSLALLQESRSHARQWITDRPISTRSRLEASAHSPHASRRSESSRSGRSQASRRSAAGDTPSVVTAASSQLRTRNRVADTATPGSHHGSDRGGLPQAPLDFRRDSGISPHLTSVIDSLTEGNPLPRASTMPELDVMAGQPSQQDAGWLLEVLGRSSSWPAPTPAQSVRPASRGLLQSGNAADGPLPEVMVTAPIPLLGDLMANARTMRDRGLINDAHLLRYEALHTASTQGDQPDGLADAPILRHMNLLLTLQAMADDFADPDLRHEAETALEPANEWLAIQLERDPSQDRLERAQAIEEHTFASIDTAARQINAYNHYVDLINELATLQLIDGDRRADLDQSLQQWWTANRQNRPHFEECLRDMDDLDRADLLLRQEDELYKDLLRMQECGEITLHELELFQDKLGLFLCDALQPGTAQDPAHLATAAHLQSCFYGVTWLELGAGMGAFDEATLTARLETFYGLLLNVLRGHPPVEEELDLSQHVRDHLYGETVLTRGRQAGIYTDEQDRMLTDVLRQLFEARFRGEALNERQLLVERHLDNLALLERSHGRGIYSTRLALQHWETLRDQLQNELDGLPPTERQNALLDDLRSRQDYFDQVDRRQGR